MPSGVMPLYMPAMSAGPVPLHQKFLLVDVITSDMFADLVPFSDMPACTVQLYQTCMPGSFIQIGVFVKASAVCYKSIILPTGRVPWVC